MQIIKKTRQVGTSSGVLLPRAWLNKRVVVQLLELDKKTIVKTVIDILLEKNISLQDIIGIYLFGSYARGEITLNSDIDILIITKNISSFIIKENFEITLVTEKNFKKRMNKDLYTASILKESSPLINNEFLENIKSSFNIKNFPFKKYLKEIKSGIEFDEEILNLEEGVVDETLIYSITLRIRELYLLLCILNNERPTKKGILEIIKNKKLYDIYASIKNNTPLKETANLEETHELIKKIKFLIEKCQTKVK